MVEPTIQQIMRFLGEAGNPVYKIQHEESKTAPRKYITSLLARTEVLDIHGNFKPAKLPENDLPTVFNDSITKRDKYRISEGQKGERKTNTNINFLEVNLLKGDLPRGSIKV
ncbi:hypothetical protein PanWU01x14_139140 [Parasponia andersonii]|uniref:Uncharacterized protein n=1 Tax=Parasponia andersonii TaxID=3476 RepID=A0A2P5CMW0_PARAD|nr:hypothetical protein PanWU01x14_139140 [Parasponia andersonii]